MQTLLSLFYTRIKVRGSDVQRQVLVQTLGGDHYEIHLHGGLVLKTKSCLPDLHVTYLDKRQKLQDISIAHSTKTEQVLPLAVKVKSVGGSLEPNTPSTPVDPTKYRGEMVWTHKTAPELMIADQNKVIKDVDIATMYKG